MNKLIYIFILTFSSLVSCQIFYTESIALKNECYSKTLTRLKKTPLYQQVYTQFRDTFEILKTQIKYFGVPGYAENKIDDAIFFKRDSSECLLIVMQRLFDTKYGFGNTRAIHGERNQDKWNFQIGLQFYHEKDYFDIFKENSFENISKLSRYAVLTSGNPSSFGCEIDENFWFI